VLAGKRMDHLAASVPPDGRALAGDYSTTRSLGETVCQKASVGVNRR